MLDIGTWAQAALMLFEESTLLTQQVHRSSEHEFAVEGDIVSVLRPYEGRTSAQVGERLWCSFVVPDSYAGRSFADVTRAILQPSMQSLARTADQRILAHLHNSIDQYMPQLPKITRGNALENVSRACEILDNHAVPANERSIVLQPTSETELLRGNAFDELRTLNLASGYVVLANEEDLGTSFIFHRNAVAFVTRPLVAITPPEERSVIAHYNDICIRMTMRYDVMQLGVRVCVEMLSGVTILEPRWIVAMVEDV